MSNVYSYLVNHIAVGAPKLAITQSNAIHLFCRHEFLTLFYPKRNSKMKL